MNKAKLISTDVNVQKCVRNVGGSQFDLILIAAERARQISKKQTQGYRDNPGIKQVKPITAALYEIQTGENNE